MKKSQTIPFRTLTFVGVSIFLFAYVTISTYNKISLEETEMIIEVVDMKYIPSHITDGETQMAIPTMWYIGFQIKDGYFWAPISRDDYKKTFFGDSVILTYKKERISKMIHPIKVRCL